MFESVRHHVWVAVVAMTTLPAIQATASRDEPASPLTPELVHELAQTPVLVAAPVSAPPNPVTVPASTGVVNDGSRPAGKPWRGQHGGDLRLLQSFYSPPREAGANNHFFDLWEPGSLATFAAVHGLTNNRALIVDSHGTERMVWGVARYVFSPSSRALPRGVEPPLYSIRDIAQVMGPNSAASVHNIVIAGCNENGALAPAECRRHFVNATNIIYMAPGNLAYKPSFFQVLTRHSHDIEALYGRPVSKVDELVSMDISRSNESTAVLLGNYVADLFVPGEPRPFRRQRAGRELLQPGFLRSDRWGKAENLHAPPDPAELPSPTPAPSPAPARSSPAPTPLPRPLPPASIPMPMTPAFDPTLFSR